MSAEELTPIIASVDKGGQYYVSVDTTSIKADDLQALSELVSAELAKDPKRPVVVQGDAQVPYDAVIQLMNALKQCGVSSVGLVTEPLD